MILLVDNFDSFTWNLVQALELLGTRVVVVRSDRLELDAVRLLRPEAIVLSPGPGRPEETGVLFQILSGCAGSIPILGVCLGHQAIGIHFGARLGRAPRAVHGKAEWIQHDGTGLFDGLPSPLLAGRYHSLALEPSSLPPALVVRATAADGTVMAIEHRALPLWGLQFHPESVLTPLGPALLGAFVARAKRSRDGVSAARTPP